MDVINLLWGGMTLNINHYQAMIGAIGAWKDFIMERVDYDANRWWRLVSTHGTCKQVFTMVLTQGATEVVHHRVDYFSLIFYFSIFFVFSIRIL